MKNVITHSKGVRVLIADSFGSSRDLIRTILERDGYEVQEADSCENLLRLVRSHEVDLILVDWYMPGVDGFSTVSTLRDVMRFTPPVVALTPAAFLLPETLLREAGYTASLVKPVGAAKLRGFVRELCPGIQSISPTSESA